MHLASTHPDYTYLLDAAINHAPVSYPPGDLLRRWIVSVDSVTCDGGISEAVFDLHPTEAPAPDDFWCDGCGCPTDDPGGCECRGKGDEGDEGDECCGACDDVDCCGVDCACLDLLAPPTTGTTQKLGTERATTPLGDRIESTAHGDAHRSYLGDPWPLGGYIHYGYFNPAPISFSPAPSLRPETSVQEALEIVANAAGVSMAPELRAEVARLRDGMQRAISVLQNALDDTEDDED